VGARSEEARPARTRGRCGGVGSACSSHSGAASRPARARRMRNAAAFAVPEPQAAQQRGDQVGGEHAER